MMPAATTSKGYSDGVSRTRLASSTTIKPPATPTAPPMPNCFTSIISAIQPSDVPPASIMVTSIRVRKIAIGSLLPDSISRVALTRSFK